jgi:mRNA interferase MazF
MEILYGCIYLVNFDPSIGREYRKVRPALVVQSDTIISISPLVTVIPVSSKIDMRQAHDILIVRDAKNRLLSDSLIKTYQISSFDKRRFIHYIGKANESVMADVQKYISLHFGV